jgi:hypothetical protein
MYKGGGIFPLPLLRIVISSYSADEAMFPRLR